MNSTIARKFGPDPVVGIANRCPNSCLVWPKSDQRREKSPKVGQQLTNLGFNFDRKCQMLDDSGKLLAEFGPQPVEIAQSLPTCGQTWCKFTRNRQDVVESRPNQDRSNFGQIRPTLANIWPDLVQIRPASPQGCQIRAKCGRRPTKVGRTLRPKPREFGRNWPSHARGAKFGDQLRDDVAQDIAAQLAKLWPKFGHIDQTCGHISAKSWATSTKLGRVLAECGGIRPKCGPTQPFFPYLGRCSARGEIVRPAKSTLRSGSRTSAPNTHSNHNEQIPSAAPVSGNAPRTYAHTCVAAAHVSETCVKIHALLAAAFALSRAARPARRHLPSLMCGEAAPRGE